MFTRGETRSRIIETFYPLHRVLTTTIPATLCRIRGCIVHDSHESGSGESVTFAAEMARLFDVSDSDLGDRPSAGFLSLGTLVVGSVELVSTQLERDETLVERSGVDHLLVQLVHDGTVGGRSNNRTFSAGQGDVVVCDLARSIILTYHDVKATWLVLPRALIDLAPGDPTYHARLFPAHRTATRMVTALVAQLLADAPALDRNATRTPVAILVAALSQLFAPLRHDAALLQFDRRDRSTLGRMCRFIDGNLDNPDLSVELLSKEFSLSRASVYRVFDKHGGVAAYIRNVRLDRAFDQIRKAPHHKEKLNVLALKFGFTNGDTFARAFEQRFGIRPLALRRERTDTDALADALVHRSGAATHPGLDRWLAEIGVRAEKRR